MTPFIIRRAVMADLPVLNDLVNEAVQQLNAPDYSPEQIASALRFAYGIDTQLIHDGTYFVAEMNGRIVGCGGWSKRHSMYGGDKAKQSPDDDNLLDPQVDPAKIRAFFVHPDYSRQGIGRALMGVAEMAARQAGFNQLELLATRTGEPLYAAVGFVVEERLDAVMPDGTRFPLARMTKMVEAQVEETAVPLFA